VQNGNIKFGYAVEAPNYKRQITNNIQIRMTKRVCFGIWSFGDWKLFGIWDLDIGILMPVWFPCEAWV